VSYVCERRLSSRVVDAHALARRRCGLSWRGWVLYGCTLSVSTARALWRGCVVDVRTRAAAVWSARVVRVMGVARVTSVVPPPPGQEWKGEWEGERAPRSECVRCVSVSVHWAQSPLPPHPNCN
jgi:hypothetical protein